LDVKKIRQHKSILQVQAFQSPRTKQQTHQTPPYIQFQTAHYKRPKVIEGGGNFIYV